MSLRLRCGERRNAAPSTESDHIHLNSWRKQKDMCTVSVIFTLAPQSPPATGEQRMILCAGRSCSEEGSLLFVFPLHQYKKEQLILVPTDTDTLLFLWVSFTRSTYPTHASPNTEFPRLACHSHSRSVPCTCPFLSPPCGHLNCPCWGVGSISIFTPSPPHFHPSSQRYASFICGAGWPIFSVWPHAAIVHRRSVLLLSLWPQAAAVGVAARLN